MKDVLKNAISVISTALIVALVWVSFLSRLFYYTLRELGVDDFILFLLMPGIISFGFIYLIFKKRLWSIGAFSLSILFTIVFLIAGYSKYFD